MKELTKLNLLCKASVYQLLQDTACFLVHPNLWIRHAVAGFIVSIAVALDTVDVQCKVVNHLSNYFKSPVIQVNKEVTRFPFLFKTFPIGLGGGEYSSLPQSEFLPPQIS